MESDAQQRVMRTSLLYTFHFHSRVFGVVYCPCVHQSSLPCRRKMKTAYMRQLKSYHKIQIVTDSILRKFELPRINQSEQHRGENLLTTPSIIHHVKYKRQRCYTLDTSWHFNINRDQVSLFPRRREDHGRSHARAQHFGTSYVSIRRRERSWATCSRYNSQFYRCWQ